MSKRRQTYLNPGYLLYISCFASLFPSIDFVQNQKLLNYDLQNLQDYVISHGSEKVVIAFQDSEAFDRDLLADLVILFK